MKASIKHVLGASVYSWQGLCAAWQNELPFRIEVVLSVFLLPLAFWLGESPFQIALLVGSWLLVLMMELLNTAIEAVVDLVSPEHHVLAGRAKDCGSAAVLVALVIAGCVWLSVFF